MAADALDLSPGSKPERNMNRRIVLGLFPGVAAIVASVVGMVPAYAADAKSANGYIEVVNAWTRPDGPTERTVYMEIINHGTTDDRLDSLSAPQAEKCVLEKSKWKGLNMTTDRLNSLPVPAMSRTQLKPGGTYIRALQVKTPYDVKIAFPLTLHFVNSGTVDVTAAISTRMLNSVR
jgi:copper(I)-binding protein